MATPPMPPDEIESAAAAGLIANELELGILKSEHLRVTLLAIVTTISLLVTGTVLLFARQPFEQMIGARAPLKAALAMIAGFLAYELVVRFAITKVIAKRMRPPAPARYANAVIESLLPTALLLLIGSHLQPAYTLVTPVVLLYFVFIALSALRLDFRLSLVTGVTSAAGYLFVVFFFRAELAASGLHNSLIMPWPHLAKAGLVLLAGMATAFVARQIRARLSESISVVEERNRVVNLFGQHVSPQVVNKLLDQRGEFGSETRHVCMMFLDIRSFTTFCEGKTPEEVVSFLNHLFGFMVDIINAHDGIINKFLGDGFMAIFGAPLSDGRDSTNAVQASLAILTRMEEERSAGRIGDARIGIGLHTGQVMTGNVGSAARKEYTVIGDTVNLAARIEGLNKQYEAQFLISASVRTALEAGDEPLPAMERIGPVQVKGRVEPVEIFKLA